MSETASNPTDQTQVVGKKPAVFVQKLYHIINECDPELATWVQGGRMFVIKDPEAFSQTKIPTCFGHNKFSSFARQLNFYGFRKVSTKPIKNEDVDDATSNHVVFYNPSFIKGRLDLLPEIQRKSRCKNSDAVDGEDEEEIMDLRQKINDTKRLIELLQNDFEANCSLILQKYQQESQLLMQQLSAIEASNMQRIRSKDIQYESHSTYDFAESDHMRM